MTMYISRSGSGSNRWKCAYGVVGRPTTRSGVGESSATVSPGGAHDGSMRLHGSTGFMFCSDDVTRVIFPMTIDPTARWAECISLRIQQAQSIIVTSWGIFHVA